MNLRAAIVGCVVAIVAPSAGIAAPTTGVATSQMSSPAGHWEGIVKLPGLPLVVRVDLVEKQNLWTGSIDIPQQHANHFLLDPVAVAGSAVRFTIGGVPGEPTFDGQFKDGKIDGMFAQGGLVLPFTLGRGPYVAPLPATRPQEAIDAAPYHEEEVSYDNGSIHLVGTLTLPAGVGPFPAVVLITGSGPQNRDEEILGHKPFLVLADHLARAGIVVLRADDRGVGKSTGGTVDDATTDELAGDTVAGINFLKTRSEVARDRIGLIGHSEGGIIAPLIASRNKDVAFIVMLAGSGVPGDQIVERQSALLQRAAGVPQETVDRESAEMKDVLRSIESDVDPVKVRQQIRAMVTDQLAGLTATTRPSDFVVNAQTNASMQSLNTRWFRYFLTLDPRIALRKVTVPALVLNGEKDLQVDPDQNLPEIAKAFAEAGNHDVTIHRLPGLNHLFQTAKTGAVDEYSKIDETFNLAAIEEIRDWILKRFEK